MTHATATRRPVRLERSQCPMCGSPRFISARLTVWRAQDWPKDVSLHPAFIRSAQAVDGPNPVIGYCLGCDSSLSHA